MLCIPIFCHYEEETRVESCLPTACRSALCSWACDADRVCRFRAVRTPERSGKDAGEGGDDLQRRTCVCGACWQDADGCGRQRPDGLSSHACNRHVLALLGGQERETVRRGR